MYKEKLFYLECLKDGKEAHELIRKKMNRRSMGSATAARDALIKSGHVRMAGYKVNNSGKKLYYFELTGKKFSEKENEVSSSPYVWDDGSMKSRGNAFDWRNFSKGLYTPSELAATEAGRKFGMATASKKILPRVTI